MTDLEKRRIDGRLRQRAYEARKRAAAGLPPPMSWRESLAIANAAQAAQRAKRAAAEAEREA